jgi:phosphate uptake regulator
VNSNITIEKLDAVIERVSSTTYAEAKQALLECDGDVIEAVILLEYQKGFDGKTKQTKKTMEEIFSKDNEDLKELKFQVKELLKKSSIIRIIVEKNGKIVMNIPLTVGVVGLALGPLVTLVGLSAAVLGKYNIMIQNEDDGSIIDLGELTEEKLNMLKQMLTNTAKEVKDVVADYKKDDKDITDELIEEDEKIDLDKK